MTRSPETLLSQAAALSGRTLAELAQAAGSSVPTRLHHHKGWIGQLIEWHLGVATNNQAQPDFVDLGIELKTLPLNHLGKPKESTYVCTAPLGATAAQERWQDSRVYHKLAKVLWVPLEANPKIPLPQRRILTPWLWTLSPELETILQQDWEELMEALHCGQADRLSAHHGTYLQIRPKAANSQRPHPYWNDQGELTLMVPKGFYLRPSFTQRLLIDASHAAL